MSKDLTSGMQTALASDQFIPVMFYEGEFLSGNLNLWTGLETISWDSKTWTGAGHMLSIAPIEDHVDLRASGIMVTLSGMSSEVLSVVLSQVRNKKNGRFWLGVMNSAGAIIADPFLVFNGFSDVPSFTDEGDKCTVSLAYESRLIDMTRARDHRWTDAEQQQRFPGDKGLAYVALMVTANILWGGVSAGGQVSPTVQKRLGLRQIRIAPNGSIVWGRAPVISGIGTGTGPGGNTSDSVRGSPSSR